MVYKIPKNPTPEDFVNPDFKKAIARQAKDEAIRELEKEHGKVYEDPDTGEIVTTEQLLIEMVMALRKAGKHGNAQAAIAALKATGLLVEKQEVRHDYGITADDHFRIREEAKKRVSKLKESVSGRTDGVGGVRPKLQLHDGEVRPHPEQEHGPDCKVDSVAVPDGLTDPNRQKP